MMRPLNLLLFVVSIVPALTTGQEKEDPLLLEYSDYYYDLYYGDYDDYKNEDGHATETRSIREKRPRDSINGKSNKKSNAQTHRTSNLNPVLTVKPKKQKVPNKHEQNNTTTRREPLNVRLQRLLTADKSSARTILDILEAPAKSQLEIAKFLRSIVARIEQDVRRNQEASQKKLKNSSRKIINLPHQATRKSQKNHLPKKPSFSPSINTLHKINTTPSKNRNTSFKTNLRSNTVPSKDDRIAKRINNPPTSEKSIKEVHKSTKGRIIEQKAPNRKHQQEKGNGVSSPSTTKQNNRFSDTSSDISVTGVSPSSSGVSIKEFLKRYPEVKRLSSRFSDGDESKQQALGNSEKEGAFTKFPIKPVPKHSNITPKQRKTPKLFKNQHNAKKTDTIIQQQENENRQKDEKEKRERELRVQEIREQEQQEQEKTRQKQKEQERIKKEQQQQKKLQKENRLKAEREQEKREKEQLEKERQKHLNQQKKQANIKTSPTQYDDYDSNYDYDYYYDQLVPEHERFFQLPKTSEATPTNSPSKINQHKNEKGFQVFTNFKQNIKTHESPTQQKKVILPDEALKKNKPSKIKPSVQKQSNVVKANSISGSAGKHGGSGGPQAGPYGYTEKGTFFTDDGFTGFPERIDMVYQGFVWAFTMHYQDQSPILHGGVHTILKDKVKSETLDLTGDYIVRVTGRASPYNINRLTFYTKAGKTYGPWGDRHSEESVDFDVSAPPGQALAYFSGTIDFGVPLRSVSFHWRPIS